MPPIQTSLRNTRCRNFNISLRLATVSALIIEPIIYYLRTLSVIATPSRLTLSSRIYRRNLIVSAVPLVNVTLAPLAIGYLLPLDPLIALLVLPLPQLLYSLSLQISYARSSTQRATTSTTVRRAILPLTALRTTILIVLTTSLLCPLITVLVILVASPLQTRKTSSL